MDSINGSNRSSGAPQTLGSSTDSTTGSTTSTSPMIPSSGNNPNQPQDSNLRNRLPDTVEPKLYLSATAKEEKSYQHHQQQQLVAALTAQIDFLNHIPDLKNQLNDISTIKDLPFEIVYIQNGQQIHVVPPASDPAPDSKEAVNIRNKLLGKLDVISAANEKEIYAYQEQLETATSELSELENKILELGGKIPERTFQSIQIIIDDSTFVPPNLKANSPPMYRHAPSDRSAPSRKMREGDFILIPKTVPKTQPLKSTNPIPKVTPESAPVTDFLKTDLTADSSTGHSKIFLSKDEESTNGNIASVNAGDTGLYVGGDGINEAFSNSVPNPDRYQNLHKNFLNKLKNQPQKMCAMADEDLKNTGLAAMYGMTPTEENSNTDQGTVMIDVFKEPFPNDNEANRAMIYVIPPNGHTTSLRKVDFIKNIEITANNIAATQDKYNQWAFTKGLPQLPVLRACAISSSRYCPKEWRADAQKAVKRGIETYFKHTVSTIKEVQYPPELQIKD